MMTAIPEMIATATSVMTISVTVTTTTVGIYLNIFYMPGIELNVFCVLSYQIFVTTFQNATNIINYPILQKKELRFEKPEAIQEMEL